MTDKEKLQKLFDAALKAPVEPTSSVPQRAFPTPHWETQMPQTPQAPVYAIPSAFSTPAMPGPMPAPAAAPAPMPAPQPAAQAFPVEAAPAPLPAAPTAPVLDDAASDELAALLDEQFARKKRKRRRETLVLAALMLGMCGGAGAWVVNNPHRIEAFKSALRDIRSVGDVKSLVAKYNDALNRVAARGRQIDQATTALHVKASPADEKDAFMDAEMKQMMGKEGGKTIGDRARLMKKNFGHMEEKAGVNTAATVSALKASRDEAKFEWDK